VKFLGEPEFETPVRPKGQKPAAETVQVPGYPAGQRAFYAGCCP